MSRKPKWQPPHPDTPRNEAAPGWRDMTEFLGIPRCAFDYCYDRPHPTFPLCAEHMLEVAEYVQAIDGDAALIRAAATRSDRDRVRAEADRIRRVELTMSRGDQPGWIYYVLTDGKVKIGYSADVTRRLAAYPPGSDVLAVHPGTLALERQMHHQFAAFRVAGREWFSPAPEILAHCEQVVAEYGDPKRYAPKVRDPRAQRTGKHWTGSKKTAA